MRLSRWFQSPVAPPSTTAATPPPPPVEARQHALYGIVSFLGAFLLFQVQPMVGRHLLPFFGGTPAVWTTCLVFFQTALLLGYFYVFVLQRRSPTPPHQISPVLDARVRRDVRGLWHLGVLLLGSGGIALQAMLWDVPLLAPAPSLAASLEAPVATLLQALVLGVGLPFLVLATTGPLVQSWFSQHFPQQSPYRLYALSNLGSLLGLLGYPFVIEPLFDLKRQAWIWGGLFLLYVGGMVVLALLARRRPFKLTLVSRHKPGARLAPPVRRDSGAQAPVLKSASDVQSAGNTGHLDTLLRGSRPSPHSPPSHASRWQPLGWILLSGVASALLLSTSNQVCQEVASIPLLWVAPLSLYLLSFILPFDHPRWYRRTLWMTVFLLSLLLTLPVLFYGIQIDLATQLLAYHLTLFSGCMVCHGELVRIKPEPARLTAFYLCLSIGGALGGAAVGLLAPLLFRMVWEYHLSLWCACAVVVVRLFYGDRGTGRAPGWMVGVVVGITIGLPLLLVVGWIPMWMKLPIPLMMVTFFVLIGWLIRKRMLRKGPPEVSALNRTKTASPASIPSVRSFPEIWGAGTALMGALLLVSVGGLLLMQKSVLEGTVVQLSRNFYGVLQVRLENKEPDVPRLVLFHGRTAHGFQPLDPRYLHVPTAYYSAMGGLGQAFVRVRHNAYGRPLRVGVVGLGVGSIAAYGMPHDVFRFYEINPDVISLARSSEFFHYLPNSRANIEVVAGDARISLQQELVTGNEQNYDLLILDAFSSDSVPVHLITQEALKLYEQHVRKEGLIAFHISNRYINLWRILWPLCQAENKKCVMVDSVTSIGLAYASTWVFISDSELNLPVGDTDPPRETARIWTDQYNSLLGVLDNKW